jgi:hypothetical protein
MKKYILLAFAFFIIDTAKSQNINKIEYFIDADPGFGSATDVPISAGSSVTANFDVALPNTIANGFHFLSIRAKDDNNNWSQVGIKPFYKETISTASIPNIVAIEYFIDADPGYGVATSVSVNASSPLNQTFTIALPNTVSEGFHLLSIRAKDSENKWSIVAIRPFYKEAISTAAIPNIVTMEYFIDSDPGYGAATGVQVTVGSMLTQNFTIALPNTVSEGFHLLSIRAKDAENKWSIVAIRPFYKEAISIAAIPNIVAMEFFIDADPGYGLGTEVRITPNTTKNPSIYADMTGLSNGNHKISIRAKDAYNKWSLVSVKDFVVTNTFTTIKSLPPTWCRNTAFNIPFNAVGTFNTGNIFTAQLSNGSGSFASPTVLGTFTGTTSGTILATIPNTIAFGNGYKVRIVSSNPSASENVFELISVVNTCDIQVNTGNVAILPDAVFCTGGTIKVPFTTYGTFQSGNQFVAQISDANGTNFINISSFVNNNVVTGLIPDGLIDGDSYRIRIIATAPGIIGNEAPQSLRIRNSDLETILSSQSGNWNDPNIWTCSRIPISQRKVTINTGQTVTAPTGSTSSVTILNLNGALVFGNNPVPNAALSVAKLASVLTSGSLNVSFSMIVASTGIITAKIYSASDYDKIIVGGLADLNGTLNIVFDAGYVPTAGNSFTVLSYAGYESSFATVNLPILPNNMTWETTYGATGLIFTIKPATALPVTLLSFDGKVLEITIQLNWKTTAETNFSHFEIQKSADSKEFGTIGNVKGISQSIYNFTDTNPTEGQNYYRLRMVDLDGTTAFSKII